MMTDFKIATYPDGSFMLVEFPERLMDDGRDVVTVRATFRIDGQQKYYIHVPVTRRALREESWLRAELERQAEYLARHPERIAQ